MEKKLYDLKKQIYWLVDDCLHTSSVSRSWHRLFPAFMRDINDILEKEGFESLCDILLLEEIHREIVKIHFNTKAVYYKYVERALSQFSSILADVDIKKATALREFAIDNYDKYYQELLCESQKFKPSRTAEINKDIWGKMLQEEENILENAEDDICVEKALLSLSRANKLCINNKTTEEDSFLDYLDSDNYITAFYFALRLNILLSETFPDTLKPKFEAWLNGETYENPETELAQEKKKEKKKGGNRIKLLFKNDKDKEEAVKCILEYIQSQSDLATQKAEGKPLLNSCWTEKDGKLNKQILAFLIEWEKEGKIVFSAPAVFRFLKNDCGLKNDCEPNSFINKILDNWNNNYKVK